MGNQVQASKQVDEVALSKVRVDGIGALDLYDSDRPIGLDHLYWVLLWQISTGTAVLYC